jgi:uroporphyrinogen-III decarboxylase
MGFIIGAEFRKVRAEADFFAVCQTPERACEVTLQVRL